MLDVHGPYDLKRRSGRSLLCSGNIVDVVAKCNEEVEKQLAPSSSHLNLHRTTSFEGIPASYDESEIVRSQLAVCVWCVGVCVSGRRDDSRALNARLQTLLAKGDLLELREAILLGSTVYRCVFEKFLAGDSEGRMEKSRWNDFSVLAPLNLPCVLPLVQNEARIIVSLV